MALGAAPWSIHAILARTSANGPGIRFAVWVQGCSLGCRGCFNPETHSEDGTTTTTGDVFQHLLKSLPLQGVTVTGGEPLQQPAALADFLGLMRSDPRTSDLSVVVLTGYTEDETRSDPSKLVAVSEADTIIAGRYNASQHLAVGLRGSPNKRYWHISHRHSDKDFSDLPESEVLIDPDGTITITGMHPLARLMSS